MAINYIDPNGNGAQTAWTGDYTGIDDAVREPTNAQTNGDGASISTSTAGAQEDQTWPDTLTWHASDVFTLWVFGIGATKRKIQYGVSKDNGTSFDGPTDLIPNIATAPNAAWYSASVSFASQAELNGFRTRFTMATTGGGSSGSPTIYAAYLQQVTATAHAQPVDDTLSLADSPTASRGLHRTLEESVSTADSAGRQGEFARTIGDALDPADELTRVATFVRSVSEELGLGDSAALARALARLLEDTLSLDDLADPVLTPGSGTHHERTPGDSLGLADELSRVLALARLLEESVSLSDSLERAGAFQRLLEDTLSLADDLTTDLRVRHTRTPQDSLGLADELTRIAAFTRTPADTLSLADLLLRVATFERLLEEVLTVEDFLAATRGRSQALSDQVDLADEVTTETAVVGTTLPLVGLTGFLVPVAQGRITRSRGRIDGSLVGRI